MTDQEIDRLLELEEEATPGPWAFDTYNTVWAGSESNKNLVEICTIPDDPETGDSPKWSRDEWYPQSVGNAELIVAARSALKPALLEVRRLRQEIKPEIPACAAIQFGDGIVIAGKRHDACIKSAVALGVTRDEIAHAVQGFMTTHGRFVDRVEGWDLAVAAGIVADKSTTKCLFSEDLY